MVPLSPTGDRETDRMIAELQEQVNRAEEIGRQLGEVRGRGEAAGGQVTVETLSTGALVSLRIDPRALRLGSEALTEAIMEAAGHAARAAAEAANRLMASLLPPGSLEGTGPFER
ncbi:MULTISPECIES: YbaB/EbfC family nucleoid-associated protein [unclassified Streptosporangium]|uniref:YbaB/EbfC family nucleoid-associated protein n=1 Tax=unclassified Streptosporangium TaxID=2632669 RepID=UPI002E2CF865|nr:MULTISPECIES: YbaB/EbfC family nucleoid-associated protein [unclassified Streptosporangium]